MSKVEEKNKNSVTSKNRGKLWKEKTASKVKTASNLGHKSHNEVKSDISVKLSQRGKQCETSDTKDETSSKVKTAIEIG